MASKTSTAKSSVRKKASTAKTAAPAVKSTAPVNPAPVAEHDLFHPNVEDMKRMIVHHIRSTIGTSEKKASQLDIEMICPLHGPVWRNNFSYIIEKHQLWATYTPEVKGVMIAYASVYGHTESAAQAFASKLVQAGIKDVVVYDVSNTDPSYLVSEAFKYSHIVLASSTYNACVFPKMQDFLEHLKMLNFQNRTIAIMENGSWASMSGNLMRKMLETMKNMNVLESTVKINSSLHTEEPLDALTESIKQSM